MRAGRSVLARTLLAAAALLAGFAVLTPTNGQETRQDPLGRETPRSAMRGFLDAARHGDFGIAAEYLDAGKTRRRASPRAAELAEHLQAVFDRKLYVHLPELSDAPEGAQDDGLPRTRDRLGTIRTDAGPVDLLLERVNMEDDVLVWKVSRETVQRIPGLYQAYGQDPLARRMPQGLVSHRVMGLALWHWIALATLLLASAGLAWLIAPVIVRVTRPLAGLARGEHVRLRVTLGPLRFLVALVLFVAGAAWLDLPARAAWVLGGVETVLAITGAAWLLTRIAHVLFERAHERLERRGQVSAVTMVPLGRKSVKVLLVLIALVAVLQSFGVNVTALVAGLGIGGIAVALAAQKTVENLFGGVALIADQPMRVGDFCRIGGTSGKVEEIGLRSTRLRTLERTLVTIPNGQVSSSEIENFARRDKIWLRMMLGLRYETSADQMRFLLAEIRDLLEAHPRIERGPRVRFVAFGEWALQIELFAYVLTADYDEFLGIREDLSLRLMGLIAQAGTDFAFPSQIQYDGPTTGSNAERRHAAEESIRRTRERGDPPA